MVGANSPSGPLFYASRWILTRLIGKTLDI